MVRMLFVKSIVSICVVGGSIVASQPMLLSPANAAENGASGLPLPRYVSLKSKRVNMRVGPGRDYKVEWMYTKAGLPLEILQEYDNWRKVRDSEGEEGWVLQSLLSGKRTALVAPWKKNEKDGMIPLKIAPNNAAAVVAKLEPGVLMEIEECKSGWCKVAVASLEGYAQQDHLWGVYPDEKLD